MPENEQSRVDNEEIQKNQISPKKKEITKNTNYHNHSSHRNYHTNNNHRGNTNQNFQSHHNNRFYNFQSPNNNHSKFNHQMQKGAMQSQHQQFHYYYAMAAAIASGNYRKFKS